MAIDLKKNKKEEQKEEQKYYYSDDGNTEGPFPLPELLVRIGPETLVYREGIEWTNANKVEELKKFFIVEKKVVVQPISPISTPDPVSPSPKPASFVVEPKKMFSAPFSFKGRIRRMEYGLSSIIYFIAYSIVFPMMDSLPIASFALIPLIWFFLAQGAKRCHDRGNSGWYQLIPFYALWMLFAESDPGSNQYGPSPKN